MLDEFGSVHGASAKRRRVARTDRCYQRQRGPFAGRRLAAVEHHVLVRAELRAVLEAFRQLPERYLTAVEDKSYAEVVSELSFPIGTMMSRVYRASQMLVADLAAKGP